MSESLQEQLGALQGKIQTKDASTPASNPAPTPSAEAKTPCDPRLTELDVQLAAAKVKRERAATYQSITMAVLTGLSAVAVGVALWQGRKSHVPGPNYTVSPK